MSLAIVQHKSLIRPNEVPGSITLTSAPTVGNLLIAFLAINVAPISNITISSNWTKFDNCSDVTSSDTDQRTSIIALYRYVQSGDTAVLPAFASAGSTYWGATVFEVSGISGAWLTDYQQSRSIFLSTGGATLTIPEMVTACDNCLVLAGYAKYNGNSNGSMSADFTVDENTFNGSNYGLTGGGHRAVATAKTVINSSTVTLPSASGPGGVIAVVLQPNSPPVIPYIRQARMFETNGVPVTCTLHTPPQAGSLILAVTSYGSAGISMPTYGSGWTTGPTVGSVNTVVAYRYASSGDSAALPTLITSGGNIYNATAYIEIAGLSGAWATDLVDAKLAHQATGATMVTANASAPDNSFAVLIASNYNGTTELTVDAAWKRMFSEVNNAPFGSMMIAEKYIATAATINATVTESNTTNSANTTQLVFGAVSSSTPPYVNNVIT